MFLGLADDGKAIDDIVFDELGIRRADLGMLAIVVALAIADVASECVRQLLTRILVDQIDDVVADGRKGRAPPIPVTANVACGLASVEPRRFVRAAGGITGAVREGADTG